MHIQSLRQFSPSSPQADKSACGKTAAQAAYRSRLAHQAETLLQKQAAGKFLNNTQKRIVLRYWKQRQAIGGAV